MSVLEVTSAAHFAELTTGAEVAVVHFWADWAAACAQGRYRAPYRLTTVATFEVTHKTALSCAYHVA